MAKYYIGTSGWSYPKGEGTWKGYFYPKGRIDELDYYSRFFNTVEVNSSFYRPPNPEYARNWARKTPEGFLFTVKLWQKFTHPKIYEEVTGGKATMSRQDVDLFRRSIEPLACCGKLGVILGQFPPSFKNEGSGPKILTQVIRAFEEYNLAVELRHRSWSDDPGIAGLLRENSVGWVHIDEPRFKSSVAEDLPMTSDIAYFRFHGRNDLKWWTGDNETRYKYLYSPEEIDELSERVKSAARESRLLFAQFNNHWQGYAPRNAIDMIKALQLPFKDIYIPLEDKGEHKE